LQTLGRDYTARHQDVVWPISIVAAMTRRGYVAFLPQCFAIATLTVPRPLSYPKT
jgi:hypothetical protein